MLSLLHVLAACTPDPKEETGSTPEDTDTGGGDTDTGGGDTGDTDTGGDTGGDTAECEPVTEACNGVDDDGFGDASVEQLACAAPDGYVGNRATATTATRP